MDIKLADILIKAGQGFFAIGVLAWLLMEMTETNKVMVEQSTAAMHRMADSVEQIVKDQRVMSNSINEVARNQRMYHLRTESNR